MNAKRKLKIGYNSRQLKRERVNGNNLKFIPQLILQGNWFQDAGFNIGDHVNISIEHGAIAITKAAHPVITISKADGVKVNTDPQSFGELVKILVQQ